MYVYLRFWFALPPNSYLTCQSNPIQSNPNRVHIAIAQIDGFVSSWQQHNPVGPHSAATLSPAVSASSLGIGDLGRGGKLGDAPVYSSKGNLTYESDAQIASKAGQSRTAVAGTIAGHVNLGGR